MTGPRSHSFSGSRRRRLAVLVALLTLATSAAAYLPGALSVLSAYLVDELEISRSQLGLGFTTFSLVSTMAAPLAGRISDVSTRRTMSGLFVLAAAGVLFAAAAPSYVWLLAAALLGGIGGAAANPVTNRLISDTISADRRGMVIGIKQAGPPMGLLGAGLVLPLLATQLGWRWALASTALLPLAGLVATRAVIPNTDSSMHPARDARSAPTGVGRATARWLVVIGFGVAAAIAAIVAFLPLFAFEDLGASTSVAGLLASVIGICGVVGRVTWGAAASRFRHPTVPLILLTGLALLSTVAIWSARSGMLMVFIGAAGIGLSGVAWHAVAWYALLSSVEGPEVGRLTGFVQFGNSAGLAAGPPIVGFIIDSTGSYAWGWASIVGLFAVILALTAAWHRSVG